MSDREKLIEILEEAQWNWYHTSCRKCTYAKSEYRCEHEQSADHLISNGVTVQKWIPVSERLPEVGIDVLVIKDNGDRNMAVWRLYRTIPNAQPYWEDEVGDGLVLKAASHWMPLPEPPKECE